jgi:hypothetical protein
MRWWAADIVAGIVAVWGPGRLGLLVRAIKPPSHTVVTRTIFLATLVQLSAGVCREWSELPALSHGRNVRYDAVDLPSLFFSCTGRSRTESSYETSWAPSAGSGARHICNGSWRGVAEELTMWKLSSDKSRNWDACLANPRRSETQPHWLWRHVNRVRSGSRLESFDKMRVMR